MAHVEHVRVLTSISRSKLASIVLLSLVMAGSPHAAFLDVHSPVEQPVVQDVEPPKEGVPTLVTPEQNNPLFAPVPSWIQDFSGATTGLLDSRYWSTLIGPADNNNDEQQYYTDDSSNLRIEDGTLRLIATRQNQPNGYLYGSARLETVNKQSFLYGRIDITAKLPKGAGTWPAVWLLPDNNTYANLSSPEDTLRYRNGGEIDILETVGSLPNTVYGVVHTLGGDINGIGSHKAVNVPNSATAFNTYTLLWTPKDLTFEVNGIPYHTYSRQDDATYTTWPFDQPFYLVANVALGGIWGGMDSVKFPDKGIDDAALPASMDIRSIYYYPYIGDAR